MSTKLFLLLAIIGFAIGQTIIDECGQCEVDKCPETSNCIAGTVLDKCGCCMLCGRLEGEKCDNYTLPLPQKDQYGKCGENMACLLRKDLLAKVDIFLC